MATMAQDLGPAENEESDHAERETDPSGPHECGAETHDADAPAMNRRGNAAFRHEDEQERRGHLAQRSGVLSVEKVRKSPGLGLSRLLTAEPTSHALSQAEESGIG